MSRRSRRSIATAACSTEENFTTNKKIKLKSKHARDFEENVIKSILSYLQPFSMKSAEFVSFLSYGSVSKRWQKVLFESSQWTVLGGIVENPVLWGFNSIENYLYETFFYKEVKKLKKHPLKSLKQFCKILTLISKPTQDKWWEDLIFERNYSGWSLDFVNSDMVSFLPTAKKNFKIKTLNDIISKANTILIHHDFSIFEIPHFFEILSQLTLQLLISFPQPNQIKKIYLCTRLNKSVIQSLCSRFKNLTSLNLQQHSEDDTLTDETLDIISKTLDFSNLKHFGLSQLGENCSIAGIFGCLKSLGSTLITLELKDLKSVSGTVDLSLIVLLCPRLEGLRLINLFVHKSLKGLKFLSDLELRDLESPEVFVFKGDDTFYEPVYIEEDHTSVTSLANNLPTISMYYMSPTYCLMQHIQAFLPISHNNWYETDNESENSFNFHESDIMPERFDETSPMDHIRKDGSLRRMSESILLSDISGEPVGTSSSSNISEVNFSTLNFPAAKEFSLVETCLQLGDESLSRLKRLCLWLNPNSLISTSEDSHRDLRPHNGKVKNCFPETWGQLKCLELVSKCTNLESLHLSYCYFSGSIQDWCGISNKNKLDEDAVNNRNDPSHRKINSEDAVELFSSKIVLDEADMQQILKGADMSLVWEFENIPPNMLKRYKKSVGVLRTFNNKLKHLQVEYDIERCKYSLKHMEPIVTDRIKLPFLQSLRIDVYLQGFIELDAGRTGLADFIVQDRYGRKSFEYLVTKWYENRPDDYWKLGSDKISGG
ncbi:hypothetical protein HK099_005874 [Clydaea vesicula]|uniref:F-box domain-containing protein n=1 Tax=Clydaea vesicula TaxID=447962 RepID=A0AAD5XYK2_9FUNG|nr:hypothetical protein HK099_005874 [Clydaea vesicula]